MNDDKSNHEKKKIWVIKSKKKITEVNLIIKKFNWKFVEKKSVEYSLFFWNHIFYYYYDLIDRNLCGSFVFWKSACSWLHSLYIIGDHLLSFCNAVFFSKFHNAIYVCLCRCKWTDSETALRAILQHKLKITSIWIWCVSASHYVTLLVRTR